MWESLDNNLWHRGIRSIKLLIHTQAHTIFLSKSIHCWFGLLMDFVNNNKNIEYHHRLSLKPCIGLYIVPDAIRFQ